MACACPPQPLAVGSAGRGISSPSAAPGSCPLVPALRPLPPAGDFSLVTASCSFSFPPLWSIIYLMLISEHGLSFLGVLPPMQLMGLVGAGRSGDDARWSSDLSMGTPQGGADLWALPVERLARLQVPVSCSHCGGGDTSATQRVALGPALHGPTLMLPAPVPLPVQILA